MTDRSFLQRALKIVEFSLDHPKLISFATLFLVVVFGIQLPKIKVDTDPENMLSETEVVRVFHNGVKKRFTLNDILVLGIVNEKHPDGVFNPDTLAKVFRITAEIKKIDGVITQDIISPSTSDNIRQGGPGTVKFEWLMPSPPNDQNSARHIRKEAQDNPLLDGTLVSEDGRALALYIPLREKSLSYPVASQIRKIIAGLGGDEDYYITGLPVAEDTFGVEMFKQMAISAPLAGLIVFLLMWWFFRKATLVISPMLTAIASIIITMGLLIGAGFTVHIMSSMIPIFLMPIAVVDSVHILSVFFDKYQSIGDRRETMLAAMRELFRPMLFTSLTSAAGFASLALTPIPPVRVFGLFVAFGIMLAWVLTITFVPAYTMFIRESSLKAFGASHDDVSSGTLLGRTLGWLGAFTYGWPKLILVSAVILLLLAGWGISRINVNDNPVKWFTDRHPIRIADDVLNRHFGGTYMAYLVVQENLGREGFAQMVSGLRRRLLKRAEELRGEVPKLKGVADRVAKFLETQESRRIQEENFDVVSMLAEAITDAEKQATAADADEAEAWDETLDFLEVERVRAQTFKQPEVLRYLEGLQKAMRATGIVGKSNSVVDLVKKVHYELREGDKRFNIIPKTANAVSQTLITFQNSHDPDDLWHLVTPDYASANIWAQLRSGDNQDMEKVVRAVNTYVVNNPPPRKLSFQWAGLTYLNVVWQEEMVYGMFWSLIGSFVVVLVMMIFLFRSLPWGFLAMVPLSLTITLVYGIIGFAGKDYDMPIAVLSSLTLGLSVDFAIHFLERSRDLRGEVESWQEATQLVFGDPARAITRNALVIAIGFLPLLAAPLVPYQTVGFFLAAIMAVSAVGTLVLLPPLIKVLEGLLFREPRAIAFMCNCWTCVGSAVAAVFIATYVLHRYAILNWSVLTWVAIVLVGLAILACYRLSRLRNQEAAEDAQ